MMNTLSMLTRAGLPIVAMLAALIGASCCIVDPAPISPAMQYTDTARGCSDFMVYKSNAAGTEYVLVEPNRELLGLSTQSKTFDITTTQTGLRVEINVYSRKPHFSRYCTDVFDPSDPSPDVWRARSGRVTISISDDNPVLNIGYRATVLLEDATFYSRDNQSVHLDAVSFDSVFVGWFPG